MDATGVPAPVHTYCLTETDAERNSLQATWIRNTILRALREVDPSASKRLNANFVFNAPTISSLSNVVQMALDNLNGVDGASHTPQDLWKYIEKYSARFPARPADLLDRPSAAKDVVWLSISSRQAHILPRIL